MSYLTGAGTPKVETCSVILPTTVGLLTGPQLALPTIKIVLVSAPFKSGLGGIIWV